MRTSGILMPIFSLPSKYGIGTLGREAYRFVDFLEKSGQSYWQILPIGPTGFGDSPYQSFSVFAGNPYFIDLDMLCEKKLLDPKTLEAADCGKDPGRVDYESLYRSRFALFRTAYEQFKISPPREFDIFCRYHAGWLEDYALFMAIKDSFDGCSFDRWPDPLKFREADALHAAKERLKDEIGCYKMQQFLFDRQWNALKNYAAKKGVRIIGDIPIYTAYDSADVWANPEWFELDATLTPVAVAGCPPDAFSEEGQLWGNPLYRWDRIKEDGYRFWIKRIKHAVTRFDLLRIDHFRAFSAYCRIPYGLSLIHI